VGEVICEFAFELHYGHGGSRLRRENARCDCRLFARHYRQFRKEKEYARVLADDAGFGILTDDAVTVQSWLEGANSMGIDKLLALRAF